MASGDDVTSVKATSILVSDTAVRPAVAPWPVKFAGDVKTCCDVDQHHASDTMASDTMASDTMASVPMSLEVTPSNTNVCSDTNASAQRFAVPTPWAATQRFVVAAARPVTQRYAVAAARPVTDQSLLFHATIINNIQHT
jgi:hypothetical protein